MRTSLPETELDAHVSVRAYKRLSTVERAFRSLKTVDLKVRPVVQSPGPIRVRGHVLLCMLAYDVDWHLRRQLRPMLFVDEDREGARSCTHMRRGNGPCIRSRTGHGP